MRAENSKIYLNIFFQSLFIKKTQGNHMYLLYLVFSDHDINTEIMGSSWRNFSQMIQTLKSSHNFCANLKCTIFWEINVKGAISFNKKGEKF